MSEVLLDNLVGLRLLTDTPRRLSSRGKILSSLDSLDEDPLFRNPSIIRIIGFESIRTAVYAEIKLPERDGSVNIGICSR